MTKFLEEPNRSSCKFLMVVYAIFFSTSLSLCNFIMVWFNRCFSSLSFSMSSLYFSPNAFSLILNAFKVCYRLWYAACMSFSFWSTSSRPFYESSRSFCNLSIIDYCFFPSTFYFAFTAFISPSIFAYAVFISSSLPITSSLSLDESRKFFYNFSRIVFCFLSASSCYTYDYSDCISSSFWIRDELSSIEVSKFLSNS